MSGRAREPLYKHTVATKAMLGAAMLGAALSEPAAARPYLHAPPLVIYNRLPKTGSGTAEAMIEILATANNFSIKYGLTGRGIYRMSS